MIVQSILFLRRKASLHSLWNTDEIRSDIRWVIPIRKVTQNNILNKITSILRCGRKFSLQAITGLPGGIWKSLRKFRLSFRIRRSWHWLYKYVIKLRWQVTVPKKNVTCRSRPFLARRKALFNPAVFADVKKKDNNNNQTDIHWVFPA